MVLTQVTLVDTTDRCHRGMSLHIAGTLLGGSTEWPDYTQSTTDTCRTCAGCVMERRKVQLVVISVLCDFLANSAYDSSHLEMCLGFRMVQRCSRAAVTSRPRCGISTVIRLCKWPSMMPPSKWPSGSKHQTTAA